MLRLGIIGAGRHGSRYAKHAAADITGLQLAAICRRDAHKGEAQARELGCDFVPNAHELINRDDVDVVALVTIPALLPDFVDAAVTAGKKLLIEKPVAPDLATGRRMLKRIEQSGTYCMAGHTLRFNMVVNAIRDRAPSLGRIDSLVFSQRFPPQTAIGWLDQPELSGGGNVMHTGVHCFDLIPYITGLRPDTVACVTRKVHTRHTEDNFVAALTLTGGAPSVNASALVTCSRSTDSRNGLIEISGENGQLVGDHVLNTLYRLADGAREDIVLPPARMTVRAALDRLVDDIESGTKPAVGFRDGLDAISVVDACYRADSSGSFQKVKPL